MSVRIRAKRGNPYIIRVDERNNIHLCRRSKKTGRDHAISMTRADIPNVINALADIMEQDKT